MRELDELKEQVAKTEASQSAAITRIRADMDALIAAQANAADPAQVAELTARLKVSTDALDVAVAPAA